MLWISVCYASGPHTMACYGELYSSNRVALLEGLGSGLGGCQA